jgi:hypothetical protein
MMALADPVIDSSAHRLDAIEDDSSDRSILVGGDDPLVFAIGDCEPIGHRCLVLRRRSRDAGETVMF